jgi:AmmeMemoRadiSam system protein B
MNKEFQKLFILIVLSLFVSSNIILFDFSLEKKREEKNFFHNYYSKSTNDYKPIGKAEGNMKIDFKIYGGIVSHDIVATSETAKYFENIKNQKPKVVFLIGPDHYKWEGVIRLSKYDFRTPYGDLKTNKTLVEKKKKSGGSDN